MAFCPNCGVEFLAETITCPDCNQDLVEKIDAEGWDWSQIQWVGLQNLPGLTYAEMVKEVLEARGIPVYIQTDIITGAIGAKGTATVGSRGTLFVPAQFERLATNVIHQMVDHI